MSEPNGTPPETSMEAILASIRRIIAEDGIQPPPGQQLPPMRPAPALVSAPQPQPPAIAAPPAQPAPAQSVPAQPITVQAEPPVQPVIVQPVVIQPGAVTSPEPPVAKSPAAVWGILGDQPAGTGEELVLTQMVAEDGSVVALDKAPGTPPTRAAAKAADMTAPSRPLDVLLLTDALPGNMPDADLAVVPPPAPIPAASPPPAPAAAAPIPAAPPRSVPPVAPARQPEPAPQRESDRVRVGLSPSETLIQSNPVLEELARGRNQSASPPTSQSGTKPVSQSSGQAGGQPPVPPVAPSLVPLGAPTVEELVRQSLEPKIQEWLNANLKEMVERLVQQEIDKISRRT